LLDDPFSTCGKKVTASVWSKCSPTSCGVLKPSASLEHFSIGSDLIPREMITAYATLKKAAATANHAGKRLDDQRYRLIVRACDEILAASTTHVSLARLDDGQRHPVQHERQRGDFQPLLPNRRHAARKQERPSTRTITSTWPNRRTTHFIGHVYRAAVNVRERLIPAVASCATRSA